jgi:hypothetical protein
MNPSARGFSDVADVDEAVRALRAHAGRDSKWRASVRLCSLWMLGRIRRWGVAVPVFSPPRMYWIVHGGWRSWANAVCRQHRRRFSRSVIYESLSIVLQLRGYAVGAPMMLPPFNPARVAPCQGNRWCAVCERFTRRSHIRCWRLVIAGRTPAAGQPPLCAPV